LTAKDSAKQSYHFSLVFMPKRCDSQRLFLLLNDLDPPGYFNQSFDAPAFLPECPLNGTPDSEARDVVVCCDECYVEVQEILEEIGRQLLISLESGQARIDEIDAHLATCSDDIAPDVEDDWLFEWQVVELDFRDLVKFSMAFAAFQHSVRVQQ
jgi:hypothetical protein